MPDDSEDTTSEIMRVFEDNAQVQLEKDFDAWRDELAALPEDFERKLNDCLTADIELHPLRWLFAGLDLIQSSKSILSVELTGGCQDPFLDSYLPYPVFQMGAEIFLKGMWLCQFDECRHLDDDSYVEVAVRQHYSQKLKDLGHDLLTITAALRQVTRYRDDAHTMHFLKVIEAVIRNFYFPLYKADKRNQWADWRYPKHFYDDASRKGFAEALKSYPQQRLITQLFKQMKRDIDVLWNFSF